MQMTPAPFHAEIADGPEGSNAWWATTSDGVRVRLGHFPTSQQARGTLLLFPGRTEYIEKYGRTAAGFTAAGYHVIAIDWRGQGLADRLLEDARIGHVAQFSDYQLDLKAVMQVVAELDLPGPMHLLGHSMGGCIGLRALYDGLDVQTCTFTGPMWGIYLSPAMRPAAWAVSSMSKTLGLSHMLSPGTSIDSYLLSAEFADNMLTTDRGTWDYMVNQVTQVPGLQLGGPSLHWLNEALRETLDLSRKASPAQPCLCLLGTNERIVDTARIHQRMARWSNGQLEMVQNGEHEVLMESLADLDQTIARIVSHFESPSETRNLSA
jgi:lysophospholipase